MNTGVAPRSTNALTVDEKVNDGTMTSSPGPMSSSSAISSRACVPEVVEQDGRASEEIAQQVLAAPCEVAVT